MTPNLCPGARWLLLILLGLLSANHSLADGGYTLLHSLFNPSTNVQAWTKQGSSVAVDGSIAVVGAPSDAVGGRNSGVAKIYNVASGALIHTLTNPSSAGGNRFGGSVGISGTRVLVGNRDDSRQTQEAGAAYLYDLASGTPVVPVLTLLTPNPTEEGAFGSAVAISGDRIAVGAERERNNDLRIGRVYIFDLTSPNPSVPVTILDNPTSEEDSRFGSIIALSGPRVIVGAPEDRSVTPGRAYVYDQSSASPTIPLILSIPNTEGSRSFGNAVGISANHVIVGAIVDTATIDNVGIAYVFDLVGPNPTLPELTLQNPSPAENDSFGSAVAIAGTRAVVGAHRQVVGAGIGAAYLYDIGGPTPAVPTVTLMNPTAASENDFGSAVAIGTEFVIVSAPLENYPEYYAGSAFVYRMSSATPAVSSARLASPSPSAGGYFGSAVALSGSRAVVGARFEASVGAAYVYDFARLASANSSLELKNPRPASLGRFGVSVAVSGNTVAIGDTGRDASAAIWESVFIYDAAGTTPDVPVLTLTHPNPSEWTLFGSAVAISETRVAVGSIWDASGATAAGRVFIFDRASARPLVPVMTLENPTPQTQDQFGSALAISGSRLVVGVPLADKEWLDSGIVYIYELDSGAGGQPSLILTNPAPGMFSYFGKSVAISGPRVVVGTPGRRAAHIYDVTSLNPTAPVVTLTEPGAATYGSFGTAVGISGERVVVGSPWNDTGAVGAGSIYVFDLAVPKVSNPVAILSNPDPQAYDWFGSAVAIDGSVILAGAKGDDTVAVDRGAAYTFGLRPILRIVPAAPGFATLSWTSVPNTDFALQYSDELAPGGWTDAPSGELNPATIPLTSARRFYRLTAKSVR